MSTIAYLDGQALAIKLAKQITGVVAEMNKRLMTLNGMSDESLNLMILRILKNVMTSQAGSRSTDIPYQLKKRIIRLVCIQNRCKEELVMVKEEMLKFVQFLNEQTRNIFGFIAVNQPNRDFKIEGQRRRQRQREAIDFTRSAEFAYSQRCDPASRTREREVWRGG